MIYDENPELQAANDFVLLTDRNIFLTGRAGTGKTTFLHRLKASAMKRMVIVAPTGVAAINAGGVTIHSFFQLPFGPIVPGRISEHGNSEMKFKYSSAKISLIKSIDLLVIDEISMVRADLLDGIDAVLRMFKNRNLPFGGVQLLMIGDLFQLSPIVKPEEWDLLSPHYDTSYFFGSNALRTAPPVVIELQKIYRQKDDVFISLLNAVRTNTVDNEILKQLNARHIPGFEPSDDEGYIQLTTHNHTASQVNDAKLKDIKHKAFTFKAEVKGDFPESMYPHVLSLELKKGAQVMFNKNDSSFAKKYYNGKIGKVVRLTDDEILVKCPDEEEIVVGIETWKNIKYTLDPKTKEIKEEEVGTFSQYPLKLAWAITIHKSQGLTFEKAIIDASSSFTHGQVYVALSRCKTLEGMVLKNPLNTNSIKTDSVIDSFTTENGTNKPTGDDLDKARNTFQRRQLFDLLQFQYISRLFESVQKTLYEHKSAFMEELHEILRNNQILFKSDIEDVSVKFMRQLSAQIQEDAMPQDNEWLQERVRKAMEYFGKQLGLLWNVLHDQMVVESDNKAALTQITAQLNKLKLQVYIKMKVVERLSDKFDALSYMKERWNAEIEFENEIMKKAQTHAAAAKKSKDSELMIRLKKWRVRMADELNVTEHQLIPFKSMQNLELKQPTTAAQLKKVKGIGAKKIELFGSEILKIINDYLNEKSE